MWFKRQQKNRRLRRGHLLDVKLRSDQVRATRTRLVSIALGVTFGTVFGLYLFWRAGEWALDKLVYENSTFAIQNIEVQTDGVIAPEQLRRLSNVKLGANLIALDLATVKRSLELETTIDAVSVERVLPRTLKIRVTEREPVAQVSNLTVNPPTVFQFDADGYVMEPLDPRLRLTPVSPAGKSLPVLIGVNVYQLQPGHRLETPQALAALKLIAAFGHSPMAGLTELRSVDVSQRGVVVAMTGQGGEVTFALDDMERQLARWRAFYDLGKRMNKGEIISLNLAVNINTPCRYADKAFTPPATRTISTPATTRRNHV